MAEAVAPHGVIIFGSDHSLMCIITTDNCQEPLQGSKKQTWHTKKKDFDEREEKANDILNIKAE